MYKAWNNQLPKNIQRLFKYQDGTYQLRGKNKFKIIRLRTTRKTFCISFCGVTLWNGIGEEIKKCRNILQFKAKYK